MPLPTGAGDAASGVRDELDDPAYRQAVVDLLGALAYGEFSAFQRLADDAKLAPALVDKAALGAMAVAEFGHFELLRDRVAALGADPSEAMAPYASALDAFHDHTAPSDWLEGLVKAYVGDGIGADFYREIAKFLDPTSATLVADVLVDTGHSEFVVDRVRAAIAAEPSVGGRLALWGRRLVGEALAQAQRVAAERDALMPLFEGSAERPGTDLAELTRIFARLTEAHTRRMATLGLSA